MSALLQRIKESLPGCVAAASVDLPNGAVVDLCAADDDTRESVRLSGAVLAATLDAPDARAAASILDRLRGGDGDAAFDEGMVRTGDAVHLLLRDGRATGLLTACTGVENLAAVMLEARALAAEGSTDAAEEQACTR